MVAVEIGGTTAMEFHCSGSCPSWVARVAKLGSFLRKPLILVVLLLREKVRRRAVVAGRRRDACELLFVGKLVLRGGVLRRSRVGRVPRAVFFQPSGAIRVGSMCGCLSVPRKRGKEPPSYAGSVKSNSRSSSSSFFF